jgi:hypothetical protein
MLQGSMDKKSDRVMQHQHVSSLSIMCAGGVGIAAGQHVSARHCPWPAQDHPVPRVPVDEVGGILVAAVVLFSAALSAITILYCNDLQQQCWCAMLWCACAGPKQCVVVLFVDWC